MTSENNGTSSPNPSEAQRRSRTSRRSGRDPADGAADGAGAALPEPGRAGRRRGLPLLPPPPRGASSRRAEFPRRQSTREPGAGAAVAHGTRRRGGLACPRAGSHRHDRATVYHHERACTGRKQEPTPRKAAQADRRFVDRGGARRGCWWPLVLVLTVFKPGSRAAGARHDPDRVPSPQQDGEQVAAAFLDARGRQGDLAKAGELHGPAGRRHGRARGLREGPEPGEVRRRGRQRRQPRPGRRPRSRGRRVTFAVSASVAAGQRASGAARHVGLPFLARRLPAGELVRLVRRLAARRGRAQPDRGHAPGGRPGRRRRSAWSPTPTARTSPRYGDAGLTTIAGLLKARRRPARGPSRALTSRSRPTAGTPVAEQPGGRSSRRSNIPDALHHDRRRRPRPPRGPRSPCTRTARWS